MKLSLALVGVACALLALSALPTARADIECEACTVIVNFIDKWVQENKTETEVRGRRQGGGGGCGGGRKNSVRALSVCVRACVCVRGVVGVRGSQ